MGNLVSSFNNWQQIKEQDAANNATDERFFKVDKSKPTKTKWRTKEDGLQGVNVKIKDGGFKLVVKNDANLIDSDGKSLVKGAWDGIKEFIAGKQGLPSVYAQIKDPKQNKVVYEIRQGESGSRRQVISFDIVPASEYPNIPDQAISKSAAAAGGNSKSTILKTNTDSTKTPAATTPAATTPAATTPAATTPAATTPAATDWVAKFDLTKLPIKQQNGVQDNAKIYQEMIISKVKGTKLADTPIFKRLIYYAADGKYGDITGAATKIIKKGMGYKDTDGSIIDKEFIEALNKESINEGYLWYGRIVEAFSMDNALSMEKELSPLIATPKVKTAVKAVTGTAKNAPGVIRNDVKIPGASDTGIPTKDAVGNGKSNNKLSPNLAAFKTLLQSEHVSQDVKDAIKRYHKLAVNDNGKLYKIATAGQNRIDAAKGVPHKGGTLLE